MEKDQVTKKRKIGPLDSAPADSQTSAGRTDCEQHREDLLDDALDDSFPASDPPSIARPPAKDC